MTTKPANILIFGATGLIGEHITQAILTNKQHFGQIGVFTSPNTIKTKSDEINKLKKHGVEVVSGDLTSAHDVREAYNGYDTIVSAVGRAAIEHQIQLIEIADAHADVKRFFPSEYGTDVEYDATSAEEKPHQQKLKARALLKTVKSLEHTYVVTGPYADATPGLYLSAQKPENEEYGSFDVKRKHAVLLGDGNGKVSLTTTRDVGKFVAAAILHSTDTKNAALRVNSFTATPKEILAEFEKQTGGESWTVEHTSLEALKQLEQEAWANGSPAAGLVTLRRIWTEGKTLHAKRDNDVLGLENGVDDLSSAVAQAIEVQRGH